MVFPSIPAYLDPANWQQQSGLHQAGNINGNPQLQQQPSGVPPPPPPPPVHPHVGSIRPGSMAERARLANIPMPETSLKCPRCESSNTKFCYFNNYSLTQPRHFCKTCRRYWTRGGALRNVPVGGGCRRNKRTKSSASSKSPASSSDRQTASSSTSNTTVSSNSTIGGPPPPHHMPSLLGLTPPQLPPLRFLSPLSQLNDHYSAGHDISLNYGGLASTPPAVGTTEMNFHMGTNLLAVGGGGGCGGMGMEQWRLPQQFPFLGGLGGLESAPGLYAEQIQTGCLENSGGFVAETREQQLAVRPGKQMIPASLLTQVASVKMEENQGLNLSRQLLGMNPGNEQWITPTGTAAWTDLTSFSSSSTTAP